MIKQLVKITTVCAFVLSATSHAMNSNENNNSSFLTMRAEFSGASIVQVRDLETSEWECKVGLASGGGTKTIHLYINKNVESSLTFDPDHHPSEWSRWSPSVRMPEVCSHRLALFDSFRGHQEQGSIWVGGQQYIYLRRANDGALMGEVVNSVEYCGQEQSVPYSSISDSVINVFPTAYLACSEVTEQMSFQIFPEWD